MADNQISPVDIPTLYSNSIRLALSFTDVRIFFGETLPASFSPDMTPQVGPGRMVDRFCIVLNPDILPQVIQGLTQAVERYEAAFGPLKKMPQVKPPQTTDSPSPSK